MSLVHSNRKDAIKAKTLHSFILKQGYFKHASPLSTFGKSKKTGNGTAPPAGTKDETLHTLASPDGKAKLSFNWVAKEKAWERSGGIRMAFTVDYLDHHGWSYIAPVTSHN